jgi:hypothetical protein
MLKKAPFSTLQVIFYKKIAGSLAKFSTIFQSFPALDNILWDLMNLRQPNKILQHLTEFYGTNL